MRAGPPIGYPANEWTGNCVLTIPIITHQIAQVMDVVETAKIYEVEPGTDIRTNKGFKLKVRHIKKWPQLPQPKTGHNRLK